MRGSRPRRASYRLVDFAAEALVLLEFQYLLSDIEVRGGGELPKNSSLRPDRLSPSQVLPSQGPRCQDNAIDVMVEGR